MTVACDICQDRCKTHANGARGMNMRRGLLVTVLAMLVLVVGASAAHAEFAYGTSQSIGYACNESGWSEADGVSYGYNVVHGAGSTGHNVNWPVSLPLTQEGPKPTPVEPSCWEEFGRIRCQSVGWSVGINESSSSESHGVSVLRPIEEPSRITLNVYGGTVNVYDVIVTPTSVLEHQESMSKQPPSTPLWKTILMMFGAVKIGEWIFQ